MNQERHTLQQSCQPQLVQHHLRWPHQLMTGHNNQDTLLKDMENSIVMGVKKVQKKAVRFVLLKELGDAYVSADVDSDLLQEICGAGS